MKGDLVLRIIISFLIPFLLLFGFFAVTKYNIFGFYSFAFFFLYLILSYLLYSLRHRKSINSRNIVFFRFFGRALITVFIFFLFFILIILLNWRISFIYDFIKF